MVGVIMDIERYDIEIENEIQKATKYSRILNTAVPYLSGSNWKLGAVERAFEKLKDSKNRQERNNRLASFLKALEDKGIENQMIDTNKLESSLEKAFAHSKNPLEYDEQREVAYQLHKIKDGLANYARQYVQALNQVEFLRERKEAALKSSQANKPKVEAIETPRPSYENPTPTHRTYEPDYQSLRSNTADAVRVNSEVVYYEYETYESKQKKAYAYLEQKLAKANESGTSVRLSMEEERMLRGAVEGIEYYASSDLIKSGFEIQNHLQNFKNYAKEAKNPFKKPSRTPELRELYQLAVLVYQNLPAELLSSRDMTSTSSQYVERIKGLSKISSSLNAYVEAYNIFVNYYNKLSNQEKMDIKSEFESSNTMGFIKDTFNVDHFTVLSPEQLKGYVNRAVKEGMIENYLNYIDNKNDSISHINRACTYMSVEEIASTYAAIRRRYEEYAYGDSEQITKNTANLQRDFAYAILYKMNLKELTPEEKNAKLYEIVTQIMKEQVLFGLDKVENMQQEQPTTEAKEVVEPATDELKTTKEADGYYHYKAGSVFAKTTNRAMAARYNAQSRFFGMSKFEQTLAKMNGSWKKFNDLWQKVGDLRSSEENEQLADQLDQMFRR